MFVSENKKIRIENNIVWESREKIPTTWRMVSCCRTFQQALKEALDLCREYNYTILCHDADKRGFM